MSFNRDHDNNTKKEPRPLTFLEEMSLVKNDLQSSLMVIKNDVEETIKDVRQIMEDNKNKKLTPPAKLEQPGQAVIRPEMPVRSRPIGFLEFYTPKTHDTFHYMQKAVKRSNRNKMRFFKYNDPPSFLSELEVTLCHFYRLISPANAPTANVHYNERGEVIGLSSKLVDNFQDLLQNPLTAEDLKNAEIVKGLAVGLTLSYIFEEDDLHRSNMNKYGVRIDFDMSMWPFVFDYKNEVGSPDVGFFRRPDLKFNVTARDIRHFPNIVDAHPYFWPTYQIPVVEPVRNFLVAMKIMKDNAFSKDENSIFSKLEINPIFIYYKFKTLLKYILTDQQMYRNIAKQHMRETLKHRFGDAKVKGRKMIDVMVEHESERLNTIRETLIAMPEFREFMMSANGFRAINEILDEFRQRNETYCSKLGTKNYLAHQIISIDDVNARYNKIQAAIHTAINKPLEEQRPMLGKVPLPSALIQKP